MDTEDDPDRVLRELKKLREGRGLTRERLATCGLVLSALGTPDPDEGWTVLIRLLAEMGDGDRERALKLDFGIDLPILLEREPSTRERDWLGDRRSGYATVLGRDVKTLSRWSDRAIAELRARLLNDTFDGDLFVVAAVDRGRITNVSLIQQPIEGDDGPTTERISTDIKNTSPEPSLPCLIYAYPRDWRPRSLTLAVAFRHELPQQIYGFSTDNILTVGFAEERHELTLDGDTAMIRFVGPRRDRVYGVWWG